MDTWSLQARHMGENPAVCLRNPEPLLKLFNLSNTELFSSTKEENNRVNVTGKDVWTQ